MISDCSASSMALYGQESNGVRCGLAIGLHTVGVDAQAILSLISCCVSLSDIMSEKAV